jgi:hypothetical protein
MRGNHRKLLLPLLANAPMMGEAFEFKLDEVAGLAYGRIVASPQGLDQ